MIKSPPKTSIRTKKPASIEQLPLHLPVALVSGRLLDPFIAELHEKKLDFRPILAGLDLSEADLKEDYLVAKKAHEFVQRVSEELNDEFFGFRIGFRTPLKQAHNLSIIETEEGDITLGEQLSKLILDARRMTNQATYRLTHDTVTAIVQHKRRFLPYRPPTQSEGHFAGFVIKLIQSALGPQWDPAKITISLYDRSVIPADILPTESIIEGAKEGMSFRFPASWLLIGDNGRYNRNVPDSIEDRYDLIAALHRQIDDLLDRSGLNLKQVASRFALSERALQKALWDRGTTFKKELSARRRIRAQWLLREADDSISTIAASVGMPIVPSFVRAFKKWTGVTPSQYRASNS